MKKFSLIDLLICLLLVAVIAVGFIKIKNSVNESTTKQKVHFSVMSTYVDKGIGDNIKVGDEVSISLKEKAYATVTGVSEKPHFEYIFSQKLQKYVSQENENKSDLILELECDANVSDTEILNNNVPIRVGEESYIHGKGYSVVGYIITTDDTQN